MDESCWNSTMKLSVSTRDSADRSETYVPSPWRTSRMRTRDRRLHRFAYELREQAQAGRQIGFARKLLARAAVRPS